MDPEFTLAIGFPALSIPSRAKGTGLPVNCSMRETVPEIPCAGSGTITPVTGWVKTTCGKTVTGTPVAPFCGTVWPSITAGAVASVWLFPPPEETARKLTDEESGPPKAGSPVAVAV